jgi:hypothetical protein
MLYCWPEGYPYKPDLSGVTLLWDFNPREIASQRLLYSIVLPLINAITIEVAEHSMSAESLIRT